MHSGAVVNTNRPGGVAKLIASYPSFMLAVFFLVPFGIMVVVSFYHRIEGAQSGYEPGFEFTHYVRFFSPLFIQRILVTIEFASSTSTSSG